MYYGFLIVMGEYGGPAKSCAGAGLRGALRGGGELACAFDKREEFGPVHWP
jgi:hypothetical protein